MNADKRGSDKEFGLRRRKGPVVLAWFDTSAYAPPRCNHYICVHLCLSLLLNPVVAQVGAVVLVLFVYLARSGMRVVFS